MSDVKKQLINELIITPTKNNLSIVLFWLGLFLVFIGAIFGSNIDSLPLIPVGTGEAILKGGSAILGAGVFAVIMKSSQFTKVFQQHIYDVFYHPAKIQDGILLIDKWKLITNALLKEVLPSTHIEASSKIEQQFFNTELEYHFEEYTNSYEIVIDNDTKIATVKNVTNSTIILSPHADNPILKQAVETDGDFELLALRMNGDDCTSENLFVKDPDNKSKNTLTLPLKNYARVRDNGVKAIRLERVASWTQNLQTDPYIKGEITRYIKGATICAKISEGYIVHFERFGLGDEPKNHHLDDDGYGFERWNLVTADNLLLPGQGYILVVTSKIDSE